MPSIYDVVIIGAGPAGSTCANLLARAGHSVLVLEKEEFPRFHIGESLLPACLPVLERLGVPPSADVFVYKQGAEFLCETTGRRREFVFTETLPGCPQHAWHVDRARFDLALRDAARRAGAEVRHGVTVSSTTIGPHEVTASAEAATFRGRYLVDASGQSRLLARKSAAVLAYERFGRASVFTHFEGVGEAEWSSLGPGTSIRIVLHPEGWGWVIPLPERRLSIGLVGQRKITAEHLEQCLLAGPLARGLTRGTRRLETRFVSNFSYRNRKPSGARFACIGDASCFLDPVFSSGVTLALRSAEGVADRLSRALREGVEADPRLLAEHEIGMDRAYRTFAGLIDRFYNSHFVETVFLGPPAEDAEMRRGIMSVLAGDVWRTGNPFQELLLAARRGELRGELGASRSDDANAGADGAGR